jgi:hypothetical protein
LYKPKLADDIVKPKRFITSFMFFIPEQGKKLKAANPSLKKNDIIK